MSYILDALKKAESERARDLGTVPSIHAQPFPYAKSDDNTQRQNKPVMWLITGLLAIILVALAWRMLSANSDSKPVAPVLSPATPSMSANQASLSSNIQPPQPTPMATQTPQSTLPVDVPPTPKSSKVQTLKSPKSPPPTKAGVTPAGISTESRVVGVSELPADIQRELPKLTISGGTYSANPAQRLLIVNNQVFLEKGQPAEGVIVEQIQQNAAILSFKGYRYRVKY